MRADPNQDTSTIISAFLANKPKKISKVWIGSQQIYNSNNSPESDYQKIDGKAMYYKVTNVEAKDIDDNVVSGVTNVKLELRTPKESESSSSSVGFLTETDPLILYVQLDGLSYRLMKTFNYTINYNSKSYYLDLEPSVIKQTLNEFEPASVKVSALYRDVDGAAKTYSNGRIAYRTTIGATDGAWTELTDPIITISNFTSSLTKIKVRLYSAQAMGSLTASSNDQYILDEETIPVLKSMDGYTIGGENLIKWSKTLPLENEKWVKSNNSSTSIGQDKDFSTMNFSVSGATSNTWYYFRAPKIRMTEDYYEKEFCVSCLIKLSSNENDFIDDYANITVAGYLDSNSSGLSRNCYKTIGTFYQDNSGTMQTDSTWTTGKWIKIYKVFKLKDLDKSDSSVGHTDIKDCDSFNIIFYISKNGSFQIKQPKLELGNIPSSWSSSPYDIEYEDILGANLLNGSGLTYKLSTESDSSGVVAADLSGNQTYTISYSSLSSSNSAVTTITMELQGTTESKTYDLPQSEELFQYSFTTKETCRLILYPGKKGNLDGKNTEITIRLLKIEKGSQATSFFLTQETFSSFLESLTEVTNNVNDIKIPQPTQLPVITVNGETEGETYQVSFGSVEELEDFFNGMKSEIKTQGGELTSVSNNLIATSNGLAMITNRITLNSEEEEPYIEISSSNAAEVDLRTKMRLTDTKLSFRVGGEETAWISNSKLYIQHAEVQKSFRIGKSTVKDENGKVGAGFLTFKVIQDGVGVYWEDT